MFGWFKRRRRQKLLETPFPAEWNAILDQNLAHWKFLEATEQQQLRELTQIFIAEKDWEGAGGLELDDEIRVTIAACACMLLLGIEHDDYRNVATIIVYRSTVVTPESRSSRGGLHTAGPGVPVLGQAMLKGPVLLVWDAVRHGARHPQRGHNVVYHEFAHSSASWNPPSARGRARIVHRKEGRRRAPSMGARRRRDAAMHDRSRPKPGGFQDALALNMLDGWVDGAPPMDEQEQHTRYVEVCTREYEALKGDAERGKRTFLDAYGATNPGEFFAVITEIFFDEPVELKRKHAALYDVLREFYRQDPAERVARR
jgi:MtfA peptidase